MSERQMGTNFAEIKQDHVFRYILASSLINSSSYALDAGCGCGYGSNILGKVVEGVVGIDICKETIAHAKKYFSMKNIAFSAQDALKFKPKEHFNTIVSFEIIEHIEDDAGLLKNFRQIGSRLICSVPNEEKVKWGKETHPWHFRHYTIEEIKHKLLMSGWVVNAIYGAENGNSPLKKGYLGKNIVLDCR